MNENGNEKRSSLLFVARCRWFWFWGVFPFAVRCFLLLFVLVLVFEIGSVLSQKQNRQMPLAAHFGFLLLVLVFCRCFHLNIALLILVFCWYEKPEQATKGKKVQRETRPYWNSLHVCEVCQRISLNKSLR